MSQPPFELLEATVDAIHGAQYQTLWSAREA